MFSSKIFQYPGQRIICENYLKSLERSNLYSSTETKKLENHIETVSLTFLSKRDADTSIEELNGFKIDGQVEPLYV